METEICTGDRMMRMLIRVKALFVAWRRFSPVLLEALHKQVIQAEAPPDGLLIPSHDFEEYLKAMNRFYRVDLRGGHRN